MSRGLRHEEHEVMQRDGPIPLRTVVELSPMEELFATQDDVRNIARGGGSNSKFRSEMGVTADQTTVEIRAAQGHSEATGVADNVPPVA